MDTTNMKTTQPFIDLGFHTVPLTGKLEREEDGKKTIPKFEKDWKEKYQRTFNEKPTKLGGTITGSISGCIAVDCDSDNTYNLFKSLDPENKFHFISRGKPAGGGTILYSYPEDSEIAIESFSLQNDLIKLDFYSDNGFIYLPTDSNKSKMQWDADDLKDLPPLLGMPQEVHTLLSTLHQQYEQGKAPKTRDEKQFKTPQLANYLAPPIELMLDNDKFSTTLFRIITPKDFREISQYAKHGYLHPENVPEGRGSEYLSKVSAILGKDSSVDKELYQNAMLFINNLWENPIPKARLVSTIMKPMLEGQAAIDGEAIWSYDKEWSSRGFSFINKLGEAVEVFFDDVRCQYYLVNFTKEKFKMFFKDTEIFSYIDTVGIGLPNRKEYKNLMPLIRTTNEPQLAYGFYSVDEYTRSFNTFQQTPQLSVLANPEPYEAQYTKPKTILSFIKHLIPHTPTRNYVLQFLRKKFTTFGYSPVILYFLGVHGSGKDTFVTLLAHILGENYIAKPTTKEFLEQYNGWIVDKYFVQLDEYGNQLARFNDKQEALGKIKAYSGKPSIQIRQMRTDGFPYHHMVTFVMTANTNPLLLEQGDRRALIIETPSNLATADWVSNAGGLGVVHAKLATEAIDFCYYLATEIEDMSIDDYVTPPSSKAKHSIIAKSLAAGPKLAYYFQHSMFEELEILMFENEMDHLLDHASESKVYEEDLFLLYSMMTDYAGAKRGLALAMQDAGIQKIPTTRDGVKAYYFKVPTLSYYSKTPQQFDEIEVDI